MTVAYKGVLPDGRTKVQVEDWTGHTNVKPYMVAAFPRAERALDGDRWVRPGKDVRIDLGFESPEEAAACFAALCCGEREIEDYASQAEHPARMQCL